MESRTVNYENNASVTVPFRTGAGYGFEHPCPRLPVMKSRGVLLLLLCMAASEVRDVQTRPVDFVCDNQTRRGLNRVAEIKSAMSTLLERLQHSVTNYMLIVANLEIQGKGGGLHSTCHGRKTQHLDQVLMQYNKLLRGMLELFVMELRD
ncbi:hypothetical protein JZ751_001914, partial [Albula glossodonta]